MIKGYGLLAFMSVFLLCGCSEENIKNDSNTGTNDSNLVSASDNKENYQIPFKINAIDSKILDLNDTASTKPLKSVRYEILLFSKEKIPAESYLSYLFEIEPNSPLKESLGPVEPLIEPLRFAKTLSDGYLYIVSFETIFREHSQEELETLNKVRDFKLFVNYEGKRYPVEVQS